LNINQTEAPFWHPLRFMNADVEIRLTNYCNSCIRTVLVNISWSSTKQTQYDINTADTRIKKALKFALILENIQKAPFPVWFTFHTPLSPLCCICILCSFRVQTSPTKNSRNTVHVHLESHFTHNLSFLLC